MRKGQNSGSRIPAKRRDSPDELSRLLVRLLFLIILLLSLHLIGRGLTAPSGAVKKCRAAVCNGCMFQT